jgi:cobalt transporter subunit CbtA
MTVFRNVVFVAAIAGLLAGVAMTAMQAYATVPLILKAEVFEKAEGTDAHNHGAAQADAAGNAEANASPAQVQQSAKVHEHAAEAWAPADGFERFAYTAAANIVTAIGFALILVAVSEAFGGITGWRQGLVWGFAGFAVFTLAPGLGLPPELPAMPAADLVPRQVWWIGTATATAAGLALIAFRSSIPLAVLGVALIVAPHVIGAPQPASLETPIPADLHHQFVVAVTVTNLVFWVVLGGIAGLVRGRFMGTEPRLHRRLA